MSNIIKLFEKGAYEEIVSFYFSSTKEDEILCVIKSLFCLKQYDRAYQKYINSRKIVESYDLISSIDIFLNILISLDKFDEIFKEIENFKSYPYINQKTEEYINSLSEFVSKILKNHKNISSNEEMKDFIYKQLKSEDIFQVEEAIFYLKKHKLPYVHELIYESLNSRKQFDAIYGRILDFAISERMDMTLNFIKNNKELIINPSKYTDKYKELFKEFSIEANYMRINTKNIEFSKNVILILINAITLLAPEYFNKDNKDEMKSFFASGIIFLSRIYQDQIELDEVCYKNYDVDKEKEVRFLSILEKLQDSIF